MNYLYCQSCFKKTAQTSDIIKFCSHCGKSFTEVTAIHESRRTPSITTNSIIETTSSTRDVYRKILAKRGIKEIEGDDNDNVNEDNGDNDDSHNTEENTRVPDINKLDVDVKIFQSKGISVKSLAKNTPRKARVDSNVKHKKRNKSFLSDYLKSTASIRPIKRK